MVRALRRRTVVWCAAAALVVLAVWGLWPRTSPRQRIDTHLAGFHDAVKAGRLHDAVEHLREINKVRAELPPGTQPHAPGGAVADDLPADLRHRLLDELVRSSDPAGSIAVLRAACEDEGIGSDPWFRFLLGIMLRRTGNWSDAHAEFQRLAAEGREAQPFHKIHLYSEFMLATCLLESGRWDEAQPAFTRLSNEHELRPVAPPIGVERETVQMPFRAKLFVQVCGDLLATKAHLPEIAWGRRQPTTRAECRSFGLLCLYSGYYARAADLLDQFLRRIDAGSSADRAEALDTRYFAVAAAVRAGTAGDKGGVKSDATSQWQDRALNWVSEDYAIYAQPLVVNGEPNPSSMESASRWASYCRHDYFLSTVRDAPNPVGSRWKLFWNDTARLTEHNQLDLYWFYMPY